jgi:histidyl-tRNA synthetase
MLARQAERERATGKSARGKETKVYVVSVGEGLIKERMQICKELWEAGIAVSHRASALSSSMPNG